MGHFCINIELTFYGLLSFEACHCSLEHTLSDFRIQLIYFSQVFDSIHIVTIYYYTITTFFVYHMQTRSFINRDGVKIIEKAAHTAPVFFFKNKTYFESTQSCPS